MAKFEDEKNSLIQRLTRKKPIALSLEQSTSPKTLRWYDLTAYGIAATVGSGIFAVVGKVALHQTGPAVAFSTVIAGILSLLTGICYLEFATAMPIGGSGYAYCYTAIGELLGWMVGWNLTLEYAFCASAISTTWINYLINVLPVNSIPQWLYSIEYSLFGQDLTLNFAAALLCLLVGCVVCGGVRFGAIINNGITALNISLILLIIIVGGTQVNTSNWSPFLPYGVSGIFSGAGEMFFSYIGFDTVSSLAGEAVNPARDLPIAVIATVSIATLFYILIGFVITGMIPYHELDGKAPLAEAFKAVGINWMALIVSIGGLLMMLATIFACLTGQPKIFQAIAKDGLLPKTLFAKENKAGTPLGGVIFSAVLAAIVALIGFESLILDLITFGTLAGMSLLCSGLVYVRCQQYQPVSTHGTIALLVYVLGICAASLTYLVDAPYAIWLSLAFLLLLASPSLLYLCIIFLRYPQNLASTSPSFVCPMMPIFPCVAVAANIFVMSRVENVRWVLLQFVIWTALGLGFYFGYGIRHSNLRIPPSTEEHGSYAQMGKFASN